MKTAFFVAGLAATLVGQALASDGYPPYVTTKKLYAKNDLRGKAAPKIEVEKWLFGTAPETKGKVVLIDFWATWCPPCRESIPELIAFKKKFGDDLVVIGVTDEKPETVTNFFAGLSKNSKIDRNYDVAVDSKGVMSKALGVQGIPHAIVVTPDGIVRWQGFPLDDSDRLTDDKIASIILEYKKTAAKLNTAPPKSR